MALGSRWSSMAFQTRRHAPLLPGSGKQPMDNLSVFGIVRHARSALHWPFGGAGQATPSHTRIVPQHIAIQPRIRSPE